MSAQPAQFPLPFTHYAKFGYDPCPTEGKVPAGGNGWYTRAYTPADLTGLDASSYNVGLRCSNIVGLDIDVEDAKLAAKVEAACRKVLKLPKATPVRIGRAPKRLLVARVNAATKGFDIKAKLGEKQVTLFQVLGAGKQFVVHGTHPDTHQPYTLSAPLPKHAQLKLVTVDDLVRLKAALLELFEAEGYAVRSTGATGKAGTGKWSDPHPWTETGCVQAWEALEKLDPDMSMDEWAQVGFALYDGTHGSDEGLALWDTWSRNGEKYVEGDCARRWRGFKPGGGVTKATLFRNNFPKVEAAPHEAAPKVARDYETTEEPLGVGLDLLAIADGEIEDVPWIVQDTLAPGAALVVGRPKGGKSLLTADMVFSVGHGTPFMNRTTRKCGVLWIAAEDDRDQIARRIKKRLAVQKVPRGVTVMMRDELVAERERCDEGMSLDQWLDYFIAEHPTIGLVIIDTHASAEAIWGGESASDAEMKRSRNVVKAAYAQARVYQDVGLKHGVAVVLVHHTRKQNGKDISDYHELVNLPQTVVAGVTSSIVLCDIPGSDPHEPSPRRVMAVRGRHMADRADLLELDDTLSFTCVGDYRDVSMTEKRQEIMEAIEALQAELPDPNGWVPLKQICDDCDIRPGTLKTHLHRMRKTEGGLAWKGRTLEFKKGPGGGVRLK